MPNINVRNITNSFQDVRLVSLASWRQAQEIEPRDRGGPYVVLQEGYDPEDPRLIVEEFVLGRSGKWLSVGLFYKLPVPERRTEYIFGTAAQVMEAMHNLPPKVAIVRPGGSAEADAEAVAPGGDEMAAAFHAAKGQSGTPK